METKYQYTAVYSYRSCDQCHKQQSKIKEGEILDSHIKHIEQTYEQSTHAES